MELNIKTIKTILSLLDEMMDYGITVTYLGEFNHEIIKIFTAMAEDKMEKRFEEKSTRKVVYHALVETLQNMNKHSDELSDDGNIGKGLFFIGKKEEIYYIITSNRVTAKKKESMIKAIQQVNCASREQLKAMYKEQLVKGKLSEKGGAGLGLIDIVRKTGEKIEYQFLPLENDNWFFIFKIEINPAKLKDKDNE